VQLRLNIKFTEVLFSVGKVLSVDLLYLQKLMQMKKEV